MNRSTAADQQGIAESDTRAGGDPSPPPSADPSADMAADPSAEPLVLVGHDAGITTFTLNRPLQFNALSSEMLACLQSRIDAIDASTRVLIIAARGKAFCAGHDLKEMRAHEDRAWQAALFERCSRFMTSMLELPQPVIARVQGVATAAGCQLVANADLAVACESSRFGVSGIEVGLFCSTPSVPLSRNLGRKRAMEMLLTGDFITADTALAWGLLNRVVPDDELDAAVSELAGRIVAKSAVAVRTGKTLFYEQLERPMNEAYAMASDAMADNMMAADVAEGIDAFREKRSPRWRHR